MMAFLRIAVTAAAITVIPPAAALTVTDYGAVPDDGEDDAAAFLVRCPRSFMVEGTWKFQLIPTFPCHRFEDYAAL